ncbi:MAG: hypothetical protein ACI87J_002427, partial [Colwellia sp.]
ALNPFRRKLCNQKYKISYAAKVTTKTNRNKHKPKR